MPKLAVNDIEMYYEIQGQGSKLVYISGTGSDLRNKPNIFDSPLGDNFTILAFDQRGMGQTDKPDKPYTMMDFAEDTADLMKAVGWRSAHVMGASFGGMVAQEFAVRYPELVDKLVLACTSSGGKGGASYPLHEILDIPIEESTKLFLQAVDTRILESKTNEEVEEQINIWKNRLSHAFGEPGSVKRNGLRRQMMARKEHDVYDRLPSLNMPTLICGGKYDLISAPSNLEAIHRQINGSRLEFFEGGHPFLDQDLKAYEVIIDFLMNP